MDEYQQIQLENRTKKPVYNLRIGDSFEYRDKGLVTIVRMRYQEILDLKRRENEQKKDKKV